MTFINPQPTFKCSWWLIQFFYVYFLEHFCSETFRKDPFLTLCTILHFTWAGGTLADVWHVTMTLSRVLTSAGPEIIRSFGATAIIKNKNFLKSNDYFLTMDWNSLMLAEFGFCLNILSWAAYMETKNMFSIMSWQAHLSFWHWHPSSWICLGACHFWYLCIDQIHYNETDF